MSRSKRYVKFHTGKVGHKTALFSFRSHGSRNVRVMTQ